MEQQFSYSPERYRELESELKEQETMCKVSVDLVQKLQADNTKLREWLVAYQCGNISSEDVDDLLCGGE